LRLPITELIAKRRLRLVLNHSPGAALPLPSSTQAHQTDVFLTGVSTGALLSPIHFLTAEHQTTYNYTILVGDMHYSFIVIYHTQPPQRLPQSLRVRNRYLHCSMSTYTKNCCLGALQVNDMRQRYHMRADLQSALWRLNAKISSNCILFEYLAKAHSPTNRWNKSVNKDNIFRIYRLPLRHGVFLCYLR
jgi:hypothetical protein